MSGTVIIGSTEWKADLGQFKAAVKTIKKRHKFIEGDFGKIITALTQLSPNWNGPAGVGFLLLINPVQTAGQSMVTVIGDMIVAMQTTLQNYENAENTNTKNLSPG